MPQRAEPVPSAAMQCPGPAAGIGTDCRERRNNRPRCSTLINVAVKPTIQQPSPPTSPPKSHMPQQRAAEARPLAQGGPPSAQAPASSVAREHRLQQPRHSASSAPCGTSPLLAPLRPGVPLVTNPSSWPKSLCDARCSLRPPARAHVAAPLPLLAPGHFPSSAPPPQSRSPGRDQLPNPLALQHPLPRHAAKPRSRCPACTRISHKR